MKALKAFIKSFEAPQRSVKIKILKSIFILLQLSKMYDAGRVNFGHTSTSLLSHSYIEKKLTEGRLVGSLSLVERRHDFRYVRIRFRARSLNSGN